MREAADGDEGPPPAVDAAIRAAARRAVSAGPQALAGTLQDGAASTGSKARAGRPWWQAARVPMAAAAMLVMTVSVTLLVDREQQALEQAANAPAAAPATATATAPAGRETSSVPEPARQAPADGPRARAEVPDRESASGRVVPRTAAPAAATTAEPAVAQSAAPVLPAAPVPSVATATPATSAARIDAAPAPAPAPAAPAMPSRIPADVGGSSVAREQAAANAAAPAPAPAPAPAAVAPGAPAARQVAPRAAAPAPMADAASGRAAASTPASPASPAPPATPERWIEQIMEMRRSGRLQEAAESLAAFRKAWPGHPLPPELSALP
jgi:hypothetical protein